MSGIKIGRDPVSEGWTYRACTRNPLDCRCVRTSDGRLLLKEPVGFPYSMLLDHAGLISQAAALRLMKAVSLSAGRAASQVAGGRTPKLKWIKITLRGPDRSVPGGLSLCAERRGRLLNILCDVNARWLEAKNSSPENLREAIHPHVLEFISSCNDRIKKPKTGRRTEKIKKKRKAAAKVLFFNNIFTKDVERGDAFQINPGIHYLASPLITKGVKLVMLDGKIPLQDVCARPPDVGKPLSPEEFISDPKELEKALLENPDISLVCLTVLERCFSQVRHLCRFIRERSRAFIAAGGVFPTLTPEHAFVHLPDVNFFVRGDGEEILPEIVDMTAGRSVDDGLDGDGVEALGDLSGVIARSRNSIVASGLDNINRVSDLDRSSLDFSFLTGKNIKNGISISTSRGCIYNCRFCSVPDKRIWRAKSASSVLKHLRDYRRKLAQIYGSSEAVPQEARRLQIWDDDFFIDPERAAAIFAGMVKAGFTVTFLQGTVNSFFRRSRLKITNELNEELLDSIPGEIFTRLGGLKIGTENTCDEELRRIGKPYKYHRVQKLALALAERVIDQEHYLILCNKNTTLENLMENFEKITELRWVIGRSFKVLEPSWLMNLYPTSLFKACQVEGTDSIQPDAGRAAVEGYGEFDYPFIIPELPARREVYEIVRRFPKGMHFGMAGSVKEPFKGVYENDDVDYLLILEYVERLLRERKKHLESCPDLASMSELVRIENCLAAHFSSSHRVPSGVVRRLAPGLASSLQAGRGSRILLPYVRQMFKDAARKGEPDLDVSVKATDEGTILKVADHDGRLELLVQRHVRGCPCAFSSKNLAFIVRSQAAGRDREGGTVKLIEKIRDMADRYDTFVLE